MSWIGKGMAFALFVCGLGLFLYHLYDSWKIANYFPPFRCLSV